MLRNGALSNSDQHAINSVFLVSSEIRRDIESFLPVQMLTTRLRRFKVYNPTLESSIDYWERSVCSRHTGRSNLEAVAAYTKTGKGSFFCHTLRGEKGFLSFCSLNQVQAPIWRAFRLEPLETRAGILSFVDTNAIARTLIRHSLGFAWLKTRINLHLFEVCLCL